MMTRSISDTPTQQPAAKVSAGQHILAADMRGTDAWQDLNASAQAQIGRRVHQ